MQKRTYTVRMKWNSLSKSGISDKTDMGLSYAHREDNLRGLAGEVLELLWHPLRCSTLISKLWEDISFEYIKFLQSSKEVHLDLENSSIAKMYGGLEPLGNSPTRRHWRIPTAVLRIHGHPGSQTHESPFPSLKRLSLKKSKMQP